MSHTLSIEGLRQTLNTRNRLELGGHDARRAAVAAILRSSQSEQEVLVIRRAQRPFDPWSGHMSFPGGHQDSTDPTLIDTALRETLEEVGLDLRATGELLGVLDDRRAVIRSKSTDLVITPFVFTINTMPHLVLNEEVANALWVPLGPLMRGEADSTYHYELDGAQVPLPAYAVPDGMIWGLTYQMLQSLFGIVR